MTYFYYNKIYFKMFSKKHFANAISIPGNIYIKISVKNFITLDLHKRMLWSSDLQKTLCNM